MGHSRFIVPITFDCLSSALSLSSHQVVAWEDKGESSSDEDNTSSVMRYGVVIIGGSVEAGDEGDDDETVPGDGSNGREGLRYVRVKLTPGKVDTLLSTQVGAPRSAMFVTSTNAAGMIACLRRIRAIPCVVVCRSREEASL